MDNRIRYTKPRRLLSLMTEFVPFHLVIVFALAAIGLSGLALSEYFREVSWGRHAVEVRGVVVDSEHNRRDGEYEYFLTFRYEHRGVEYVVRDEVGGNQWSRKPVGTIDHFYVHDKRPGEIRQVLGVGYHISPVVQWVATAFWLPVLGMLGFAGLRAARAVNVRRFGDRVPAEIVAIEQKRSWVHKGQAPVLVWQTDAGRFGSTLPMDHKAAARFSVGDRLWVYVGPNRDWWEGDVGQRAEHHSKIPAVP